MNSSTSDVFTESTPTIVDCSILEAAKENIQPLAAGRRVTALAGILSTPHAQREAALATARRRLQTNVALALEDFDEDDADASDPLEAYAGFVSWTLEHYPHGQSRASNLLPLLEEATRVLKDHGGGRWRQDARYLKLWTLYASFVERPEVVWRFLLANDIGTAWAAMYESMANVLEREGRKTDADEIYLLGIARNAEPVERLQTKHREFQKRMMAGAASAAATAAPEAVDGPAAPAPRRKVLGDSTKKTARAAPTGDAAAAPPAPAPAPPAARPNARMQVFVDEAPAPRTLGGGAPANAWPELGTRVSRVKENVREVKKMGGTTLKQAKAGMGARPAAAAAAARTASGSGRGGFAIFVDPEGESARAAEMPPPPVPAKTAAKSLKSAAGEKGKQKDAPAPIEQEDEPATPAKAKAAFVPFRDEPEAPPAAAGFTPFRDETATPSRTSGQLGPPAPESVMKPKATPGMALAEGAGIDAPLASSEAEALRKDPLKNYN